MAQKYTITDIAPNEPTTWQGPHGLVYYITVKVAEHPKPIEVGKKAANALSVGDELYGNITPGKFDVDKFKPEQRPDFGGGQQSFGGQTSKPQARDDHTQESIARSVALKAAVDIAAPTMKPGMDIQIETLLAISEKFLAWLQGSSESTDPKAATEAAGTTASEQRESMTSTTNPNKPWERLTKNQTYDEGKLLPNDYKNERDEFNDMRSASEEPLPPEPEDW